jgi:hypothetical protein
MKKRDDKNRYLVEVECNCAFQWQQEKEALIKQFQRYVDLEKLKEEITKEKNGLKTLLDFERRALNEQFNIKVHYLREWQEAINEKVNKLHQKVYEESTIDKFYAWMRSKGWLKEEKEIEENL